MLTVLHLVGSPTSEFYADLSRLYAADCLASVADPDRWRPRIVHVSPGGWWRFPESLAPAALEAAPTLRYAAARAELERRPPDVAIPQMFCHAGMTDFRSLLDDLRIPFVGNRAEVMALGASKTRTKQVAAAAGIAVPSAITVCRDRVASFDTRTVRLPAVVKPADADNSAGVTLVRERADLRDALDAALAHSSEALVEDYVELGREVRCGVLERDDELQVLPLEEYAVDAQAKPIRDAADKLAFRDGELRLVAKSATHAWTVPIDDPATAVVGEAARRAHRALGARHYSLFDFRIDPAGRPWLLEASLYCSFARSSVIATMAAAAAIDIGELFALGIDQALFERGGSHGGSISSRSEPR